MFFFWAPQKKVLIPSMYFSNYSKSKNMSVGKICIKLFEFACMTVLSPETVSIVYVDVPLWKYVATGLLKLINAFIFYRQQRVVVNGVKHIGPLLFLVSHSALFFALCYSP